jgi:Flp pilus assembly protein TadB
MRQGYRNWQERRRHRGPLMPLTYLILELILLMMIIYVVSVFNIPILTLATIVLALHYFITSCLPRYHRAIRRQKYIKDREAIP